MFRVRSDATDEDFLIVAKTMLRSPTCGSANQPRDSLRLSFYWPAAAGTIMCGLAIASFTNVLPLLTPLAVILLAWGGLWLFLPLRARSAMRKVEELRHSGEFDEKFSIPLAKNLAKLAGSTNDLTIDADGITVVSEKQRVELPWAQVGRVWREPGYLMAESSSSRKYICVAIPVRSLPAGTDEAAMLAVLEALWRGEPVAGLTDTGSSSAPQ